MIRNEVIRYIRVVVMMACVSGLCGREAWAQGPGDGPAGRFELAAGVALASKLDLGAGEGLVPWLWFGREALNESGGVGALQGNERAG